MNWLKVSLLALVIVSSQAFTKESAHIITGSSKSSLSFDKSSSFDDSYDPTLSLNLGYDYAFAGGMQLGGNVAASIYSAGSVWALSFGPGYNFSSDVESSFFTSLHIGLLSYHATDANSSSTDTYLILNFGKRFKLMENVSYVPGLTLSKLLGSYSPDPSFSFELFRLSILF